MSLEVRNRDGLLTLPSICAELASWIRRMKIASWDVATQTHNHIHDMLGIFVDYVITEDVV